MSSEKTTTGIISPAELKKKILEKNVFPDYVKDIYSAKIDSGKFSDYWLNRINEIVDELEAHIQASK